MECFVYGLILVVFTDFKIIVWYKALCKNVLVRQCDAQPKDQAYQ